LHKNSRIKANNDLISASLEKEEILILRISSFCVGKGSGNAEGSKGAGTRLRREGSKGSEGGGIAAFGGDEFYIPPAAATLPEAAKTIKPGLRPVGNAIE
jgi:uncharacterized spore protein YtfJ